MTDVFLKACSQYGITEIVGKKHNPIIVQYFTDLGFDWIKDDETPWCSAFVNWCAKTMGFEYTGKLNARSWLNIGIKVEVPNVGDIVVFSRGDNPEQGHVGFYVNKIGDIIYVLGGNQGNSVSIKPYSFTRLLGFRRINKRN